MEKMNEAVYLISLKTEVSLIPSQLSLKRAAIHLSFISFSNSKNIDGLTALVM